MGRVAAGVRGMDISSKDRIIGAFFVSKGDMIFVSSGDLGKRFSVDQIKKQARGGKGLLVWSSPSLAKLGGIDRVMNFTDGLVFIDGDNYNIVSEKDIPSGSRDSVGDKFGVLGTPCSLFV